MEAIFVKHGPFTVKYKFFYDIFVKDFNISFKSPATDVCSKCLAFQEILQNTSNSNEKVSVMANQRIHKLKAKAFYDILRNEKESEANLTFDCQKNLVLPKIPDQACYY